eukprot:Sspe_Gene.34196::Locus_16639_Transcript_1_6_Confidence_0.273_Length_1757::g.34196::m.34196
MKRRLKKVQKLKQQKEKEESASKVSFVNPRDVKGARGHELRQGTLGVEFAKRGKAGGIRDLREGGDAPDDDQQWSRMAKVRSKGVKRDAYKLEDREEGLTHLGQSIGKLSTDRLQDMPEGYEDEEGEKRPGKKRKDEVYAEIVEKSKAAKEEKRQEQAEKDQELADLDNQWSEISSLLPRRREEKSSVPGSVSTKEERPAGEKKAKVLVLDMSGKVKSLKTLGQDKEEVDDETQKKMDDLLAKCRAEAKEEEAKSDTKPEVKETPGKKMKGKGGKEVTLDDYDSLMLRLADDKKATAGSRTKSGEEVASEAMAQLKRLQREKMKRMRKDDDDDDEKDDLHIPTYKPSPNEDEDTKEGRARKQAANLFDGFLTQLEEECDMRNGAVTVDFDKVDRITKQLHNLAKVNSVAVVTSVRGLLEVFDELQNSDYAATPGTLMPGSTPFVLIACSIFSKVFPPSDFRHPVTTPLMLLLTSSIAQTPLNDIRCIAVGLYRCALVLAMVSDTRRYCGEVLVFLANVLSMSCEAQTVPPTLSSKEVPAERKSALQSAMEEMEEAEEDEEGEEEEEEE